MRRRVRSAPTSGVLLRRLTEEAGASDADRLAREWQLLMTGAIVAADEQDGEAAQRTRGIGLLVLERKGLRP